jgi:hypothetical protein
MNYKEQIEAIEQDLTDMLAALGHTKVGLSKYHRVSPRSNWGEALSFLDAATIKLEEMSQELYPPDMR